MKVLITGANGFLAKQIKKYYSSSKHELLLTTRAELDPSSYENVKDFFKYNNIDVVIHTATKGGKRGAVDSILDLQTNIKMFNNLQEFSDKYKVMITFGSGAEFDRTNSIVKAREEQIFDKNPTDYYGMSKNIVSRLIASGEKSNIFNLRLFGCFGEFEEEQRLFRNSFSRIKAGLGIAIHQDKYMDYVYADDVVRTIEFIIENGDNILDRDINVCYKEKYLLSEMSNLFSSKMLGFSKLDEISSMTLGNEYTGDNARLSKLGINFIGFEKGIEECLTKWNKY